MKNKSEIAFIIIGIIILIIGFTLNYFNIQSIMLRSWMFYLIGGILILVPLVLIIEERLNLRVR